MTASTRAFLQTLVLSHLGALSLCQEDWKVARKMTDIAIDSLTEAITDEDPAKVMHALDGYDLQPILTLYQSNLVWVRLFLKTRHTLSIQ